MIGFLLGAGVLLVLGVGVLLRPLLFGARPAQGAQVDAAADVATDAVVELFRDKLRELEAERQSGAVEPAQYERSRRELERQLLEAVTTTAPKNEPDSAPGSAAAGAAGQARPRRAVWSAVLVGSFMLLVPVVLYSYLGAPGALIPGAIPPAQAAAAGAAGDESGGAQAEDAQGDAARPLTGAQVQKMIENLVDALKSSPGDVQGWVLLARAYSYQHQYPEAVHAFTKAVALTPGNARLLADLADAMAMTNGQRLDGEPLKLVERALQIDPKELKALALAGTAAFDHQEYAKAIDYWERALQTMPKDGEFTKTLRSSLEEARQLAAGNPPAGAAAADNAPAAAVASGPASAATAGGAVRGRVTLAAALAAKARPDDIIFVFARAAQGSKVPLALLRRHVKDLPFEFVLDDSTAMVPEYTVSKYASVIVGARISRSGDAPAAAGDLQGFSKPVALGATGVDVTIDQVVQ